MQAAVKFLPICKTPWRHEQNETINENLQTNKIKPGDKNINKFSPKQQEETMHKQATTGL